jgi:hypothetical protein
MVIAIVWARSERELMEYENERRGEQRFLEVTRANEEPCAALIDPAVESAVCDDVSSQLLRKFPHESHVSMRKH